MKVCVAVVLPYPDFWQWNIAVMSKAISYFTIRLSWMMRENLDPLYYRSLYCLTPEPLMEYMQYIWYKHTYMLHARVLQRFKRKWNLKISLLQWKYFEILKQDLVLQFCCLLGYPNPTWSAWAGVWATLLLTQLPANNMYRGWQQMTAPVLGTQHPPESLKLSSWVLVLPWPTLATECIWGLKISLCVSLFHIKIIVNCKISKKLLF